MKPKLKAIMDAFHKHNSANLAFRVFGLSADAVYDALVVAPSFTPYKLIDDETCIITTLREGSYIAGYLVEKDGMKIAWIKTASGACNCIDHMAIAAELNIKKLIFIGAVGALTSRFELGDICTPTESIAGNFTNTYLRDSLSDYLPFERVSPDLMFTDRVIDCLAEAGMTLQKATVFCTDSIACEYIHLDEIRAFGTDLIEMETASFYRMCDLMEVPGVALLVVSDNSATGAALVGRTEEEEIRYNRARKEILPRMIFRIAGEM